MTVLWLASDRGGTFFWRVLQPATSLKERGVDSRISFHRDLQFSEVDPLLDGVDVVVVHRPVDASAGGFWQKFIPRAQQAGARVFVDIDDDLWSLPKHNPSSAIFRQGAVLRSLERIFQAADGVTVSTVPLGQAVHYNTGVPFNHISVCPNHLVPDFWALDVFKDQPRVDHAGKVVITWAGSATHGTDLRVAVPALKQVLERYPQAHLRLLGDCPVAIQEAIPTARYDWCQQVPVMQYPGLLYAAAPDILIAPLTDCAFNRSKSPIKFLEAGAFRIPFVGSAVRPYADTVDHGKTGFLCESTEDWARALSTLIEDPELGQTVASAAHEDAWANYSFWEGSEAWLGALGADTAVSD